MARLYITFLLLCLGSGSAFASSIERLVMPGELIQGHAKTEEKCEACHTKFGSNADQNRLCIECHKEVGADATKGLGFHGKMPNAKTLECRSCHTDHRGRNARVVSINKETFDHNTTDFALKGGHTKVACDSCHQQGKKWREAPTDCYACHKEDDKHQGNLGKLCANCHTVDSWRQARFDHSKTKFKLEGAHEKVLCAACHPGSSYKNAPTQCIGCHKIDDVHAGRYGKTCTNCHSSIEWKKPRFDHDKTKFPLRDKHVDVACDGCHKGEDLYKDKVATTCNGCHKSDDVHRGKNGPKCESCHDTKGWGKYKFDHDKTKFPLRNAHKEVKNCESCHKGDVYKVKLDTNCYSCHKGDDRHNGQLGKQCESCHNDKKWNDNIRFDHELTHFPLIGQHATAPCEACHLTKAYKDAAKECVRCHADDDKHKTRLGSECATCHTPNDWKLWKFNHDTQTDYKLTGKHKGLDCAACHRDPMGKKVQQSAACAACHLNDDIHLGRFSTQCERCHTTSSFKDVTIKR